MRKLLVIALLALASCGSLPPAGNPATSFTYKGMVMDVSAIASRPDREAILADVRAQIDLIDADITEPRLRKFVFSVPLRMAGDLAGENSGGYVIRTREVVLFSPSFSRDRPVILHELLHAYHDQKLPGGQGNARIGQLYWQARNSGRFPADSYMLSNSLEYFAMMASVYLHGSAAREPFTRAAIREKQPDCYAWLVKEFGPR